MECDKVIIIASQKLSEMKLDGLIGNTGIIVENLNYYERKNKGYMVHFNEPYLDEYLWFIPLDSIQYDN